MYLKISINKLILYSLLSISTRFNNLIIWENIQTIKTDGCFNLYNRYIIFSTTKDKLSNNCISLSPFDIKLVFSTHYSLLHT